MESFDLNLDNLDPITLDIDAGSLGGAEFLMNTKKINKTGASANFDLGDLDNFESEMNSLSGKTAATPSSDSKVLGGLSSFLGFGSKEDKPDEKVNLGQATKETGAGNTKTWDGYMKFNDIPTTGGEAPVQTKMTEREKLRKKKLMIKRLEEWRQKGLVSSNTMFGNDTPYEEIEDEYETVLEDKKKSESKKLYSWWFMTAINTMEYANAAFNPFDINLDGWGESVSDDIDSYDEIFGELYEKYKGGKMSPEVALVMRLGFSAAVTSFTNKALSSATPGFNDVIRQSPELMKTFTNATVNAMAQQSPGFAFANNLVNPEPKGSPPPKPVDPRGKMVFTEQPSTKPPRPDQYSRPDLGPMFAEQGVDLNSNRSLRPEMAGPKTNIDSILSGLKPRAVNIQDNNDNDSRISVKDLKELNSDVPRRRKGSEKNIVSLDI
jgi:hypothetical protein